LPEISLASKHGKYVVNFGLMLGHDTFESPKFLLTQTRGAIVRFGQIAEAYFEANHAERTVSVDPKTGWKTYKATFANPLPAELRHIAFTAVNDLRHALDQILCTSVEAITGRVATRSDYFPIGGDPRDFEAKLRVVPDGLKQVFRDFQVYPRSAQYDGGDDLLCDLSKAAQRKHRLSCRIGAVVAAMDGGGTIDFDPDGGSMSLFPQWNIHTQELIYGTTGPKGHLIHTLRLSGFLVYYDAGPLTGRSVVDITNDIIDRVESILRTVEHETLMVRSRDASFP